MPSRVGIDLVSVDSIHEAIASHGSSYLKRVYTERELADCRGTAGVDPRRLAARFAAKEAAFKALRVGDEAVSWREVEIQWDPGGWVKLLLNGEAARLAQRARIAALSLSITRQAGYAVAIVIAEIPPAADISPMNQMIRTAIRDHGRLPVDVFTLVDEADLYQAGMTSHASVNVMLALEDAFDIEFPDHMLKRSVFESVAAIRAALMELEPDLVT